ncbi:Glycosyl transferase family 2 [Cyclobacterium lianum]|uniref:Glycosyl transferase family 2 n=1 Tax=Cyclobacterium lianum TaxID=388280 RepID=A0A1M7KGN0_9BACT|nr:glycosyltransferase [Cyclobacterium lianum]SHM64473.1 Glycosyl transferase family 2 [Cyclobacterium lianum]
MQAIVVTPVKNSLVSTLDTIGAIFESRGNFSYWVFNDYSTPHTKRGLEDAQSKLGFELVHLEDLTSNPSPNYKTVLQFSQKKAIEADVPLIIVESDVTVQPNTLQQLLLFAQSNPRIGMVGAITHDKDGNINFPYLKFKKYSSKASVKTDRSLSFCCTLISKDFLKKYDFSQLDKSRDWYDTHISRKSLELGFDNHVLMNLPVQHNPHGSRPWKQLKYKNPILYYFKKWFSGKDKI